MENLANKNQREAHYTKLEGLGAFVDCAIDDQIRIVYDELKSYIEGLVCCNSIHHNILDREARFEHALVNLKFLAWERLRQAKMSEKGADNIALGN